ncbi:MAG: polysaccharide biosynthesis protein [Clostridia bacterium]|nr:polysaccharide biosynthesis protein [Clostridia bacterium]
MSSSVTSFSIRNRVLYVLDIFAVVISYLMTILLIKNIFQALPFFFENILFIVISTAIFSVFLLFGKVYTTMWVYAGARDYLRLGTWLLAASISVMVCGLLLREHFTVFFKLEAVATLFSCACIILLRFMVRGLNRLNRSYHSANTNKARILIAGAGEAANILLREVESNSNMHYSIVGIADDDPQKKNRIICGARVLGSIADITKLTEKYDIEQILIAIPSLSPHRKREILEICSSTECKVKIIPGYESLVDGKVDMKDVRNVQIEDLLGREPVVLDNKEISDYITGKVIFVTGGGGSIGSELCRQIMKFHPEKLVIIDIYENNAYDIQMELNHLYPDNKPDVIIASVRDVGRLETIFEKYKPYIVFHAAAHKHVPLMEDSPSEAVKNNVFGTYNVAKCADKYGVRRFVMISTDKAVNPTNVMGATKRICEMIVQCMQQISKTEFVAVRFGNVLGSNGSVIPLFKRQIEAGGPVTVTHRDITRFFMTIPEAAQLVLQAASYANGGEIFVLDMGESVKIYDLAVNLIKLSGYKPNVDIKIEFTGLRPGEKLYEELLMNEEGLKNTKHSKIFIGQPIFGDISLLKKDLAMLESALETNDDEYIKDTIAKVVPTYARKRTQAKQAVS